MTTDKKPIALLAKSLIDCGLKHLVHSPGSRNAPIIIALSSYAKSGQLNIITVIDERSAAFYAMGLALETGKTVAIDCTSGSAALNYAPAIAEAYYQQIPLLVLTADRSPNHIDIGDGQTIRQTELYKNYIKKSYTFPQQFKTKEELTQAEAIAIKAFNETTEKTSGPVHINIPLDEPLYNKNAPLLSTKIKLVDKPPKPTFFKLPDKLKTQYLQSKRVMILIGQSKPNPTVNLHLNKLALRENIVILSETTSNSYGSLFIDGIDNVLSTISKEKASSFAPELLITFGGAIVSKMIKNFLRTHPPQNHWHISTSGEKLDTYFCLSDTLQTTADTFLNALNKIPHQTASSFSKKWLEKNEISNNKHTQYLKSIPFSDLKVFSFILKNLPENSNLHLGNSTPVRYSQLFGTNPSVRYYSNRGVSGIDGQLSTAAGVSTASQKRINLLITGDLGFLYDSNGLLLMQQCQNLKVVVINNQGGSIFRFIPGPDTVPDFEKYFEASHHLDFEHLTKAFNLKYLTAQSEEELNRMLPLLFDLSLGSTVLEIKTSPQISAEVLRNYFTFLQKT